VLGFFVARSGTATVGQQRRSNLTVVVRQADDVVDLQAFAEAYARALLAEAAAPPQARAA